MAEPMKYGLVLSGGGARGAYEAGVLYYIRTRLPPEVAQRPLFSIYSGTSVGAINCAQLAATAADPLYQGAQLRRLWQHLEADEIYYADWQALAGFLVKSGFFTATNFFGLSEVLGRHDPDGTFPFRSVLDTTPFVRYLRRNVAWQQIHRNIERGVLDAVTVSATHMLSGRLTLFVEKRADVPYHAGGDPPVFGPLSTKHVLASAAIPIVFPIIRINRQYYGDGSMRQNTPMSPAIHLGAERLLVISLRERAHPPEVPAPAPAYYYGEPQLSDILGKLLNTIFLDKLEYDLDQMRRINYLIDDYAHVFGDNALAQVNARREEQRRAGLKVHPIRKLQPFVISPSEDIGALASQHLQRLLSKRQSLNAMQRFFARLVTGSPESENDFISYLLFERDYLETLLELGYEDARREHDHLVNFLTGHPLEAHHAPPPGEG